MLAVKPA